MHACNYSDLDARRESNPRRPFTRKALYPLSYVPVYGGSDYFLRDFFRG